MSTSKSKVIMMRQAVEYRHVGSSDSRPSSRKPARCHYSCVHRFDLYPLRAGRGRTLVGHCGCPSDNGHAYPCTACMDALSCGARQVDPPRCSARHFWRSFPRHPLRHMDFITRIHISGKFGGACVNGSPMGGDSVTCVPQ